MVNLGNERIVIISTHVRRHFKLIFVSIYAVTSGTMPLFLLDEAEMGEQE